MALVGSRRRHLGLTLEVPRPNYKPTRIHFPDPVPPPVTSYSSSSSSSSSSSGSVSDFEKLEVLGHGNGGTVYKVRHRHQNPNFYYAMKLLHSSDYSDPVLRRQISREINVFRRASDSPFVVRLHSVLSSDGPSCSSSSSSSPALLLEYMDAGTLGTLLRRHRRLPESILPSVARKVLLGLSYLHSQKIVHRDIKPSNLLVNSAGEIKISDFGVSRIMTRSLDPCDSFVGTCAYMSPERFDPDTYGAKYDGYAADVWSLGLTVMELYLGHFPLVPQGQRPDWATLMCAICFGDPPGLPNSASPELRGFVECCLRKEPSDRWSVAELLNHPFVNGDDVARSETAFRNLLDSNPTVKEDEM